MRGSRALVAARTCGKIGSDEVIGKKDGFRPRRFRPAPWLPGPHAQTIAGRLLRRLKPPPFERERIELPDGDFVDLDHPLFDGPADAPVVLVTHGLEGSARRGYAINTYRELAARGIRAIGLNFRSCSGEPNRNPRFYHSGDTADAFFVLRLLADRYPDALRGAIGFSLGGNVLLKLLGELGEEARPLVAAAVAISVPYDLSAGADALDGTRMGRFYTARFLTSLIAKAEARAASIGDRCDLQRIRSARSFREFDDAATAPMHGFGDAADYYARSSSRAFLPRIRVPTLLLHAADDPFLPAASFPHAEAAANAFIHALMTPTGGHVGFIEGMPWAIRFWAEEHAAAFMASRLMSAAARPLTSGRSRSRAQVR
jgi:hypothetical protein